MFQSHDIASFNESQFLDFSEIVARNQKKGISLTKMREQTKANKFSFGNLLILIQLHPSPRIFHPYKRSR